MDDVDILAPSNRQQAIAMSPNGDQAVGRSQIDPYNHAGPLENLLQLQLYPEGQTTPAPHIKRISLSERMTRTMICSKYIV
ncbi:MAG: hypothetical protein POG74_08275 [Acidocella sp.]|nr:hypothetical protein [Acidocella sp.]